MAELTIEQCQKLDPEQIEQFYNVLGICVPKNKIHEDFLQFDINCFSYPEIYQEYMKFLRNYIQLLENSHRSRAYKYYNTYIRILGTVCNFNVTSPEKDDTASLVTNNIRLNSIILLTLKVLNRFKVEEILEMFKNPIEHVKDKVKNKLISIYVDYAFTQYPNNPLHESNSKNEYNEFMIFATLLKIGTELDFDNYDCSDIFCKDGTISKAKAEGLLIKYITDRMHSSLTGKKTKRRYSKCNNIMNYSNVLSDDKIQLPVYSSNIGLAERRIIGELVEAPKFENKTGKVRVRDRFKENQQFKRQTLYDITMMK